MRKIFLGVVFLVGIFGYSQESLEKFLTSPTGVNGMWLSFTLEDGEIEQGTSVVMFTDIVKQKSIHKYFAMVHTDTGIMEEGEYYVYNGSLWFRKDSQTVDDKNIPMFEEIKKVELSNPIQNSAGDWIIRIGTQYFLFLES
jgi:hypothetical protein